MHQQHVESGEGDAHELQPLKAPPPPPRPAVQLLPGAAPAALWSLTNLFSVVAIVICNKKVLSTHGFRFPVCLTWIHVCFTAAGMVAMAAGGVFEVRRLPLAKTLPIACVYASFIVFNNWSVQLNSVGFYQVSKIAITPTVVAIEFIAYRKAVSSQRLCAIALLLCGVAAATVSDAQLAANPLGALVAGAAVTCSATYQIWAGRKQQELGVDGNQLLHQVAPSAAALLALLVPAVEPVGLGEGGAAPGTILGFSLTWGAAAWILASSLLGLLVTLSTCMFIGLTSPLTYNVVGHLKTVGVVASGAAFSGDDVGPWKLLGLACAVGGVVWYSGCGMAPAPATPGGGVHAAKGDRSDEEAPAICGSPVGKQQQQRQRH